MFTGLVQHVGRVASIAPSDFGVRLSIDAGSWSHRPKLGESICVDGCCLTYALEDRGNLGFDVVQQTLGLTTLGRLRPMSRVNLEHAVTASTLLGGHIVQGHVDGIGRIVQVNCDGGHHRLHIEPPAELLRYAVPQGSIAVNGVSLTIAAASGANLEVALIPTTLELTNLGILQRGDFVNLEMDYLAKLAIHHLDRLNLPAPTKKGQSRQLHP